MHTKLPRACIATRLLQQLCVPKPVQPPQDLYTFIYYIPNILDMFNLYILAVQWTVCTWLKTPILIPSGLNSICFLVGLVFPVHLFFFSNIYTCFLPNHCPSEDSDSPRYSNCAIAQVDASEVSGWQGQEQMGHQKGSWTFQRCSWHV